MSTAELVRRAIAVLAQSPPLEEDEAVLALYESGLTRFTAEILIVFVPAGLARPLIRRVSKGTYDLPDIGHVVPERSGGFQAQLTRVAEFVGLIEPVRGWSFQIQLSRVPEFVEAERIGEATFETGQLPRNSLQNVAVRSAEFDVLNQALNAGAHLAGCGSKAHALRSTRQIPGRPRLASFRGRSSTT